MTFFPGATSWSCWWILPYLSSSSRDLLLCRIHNHSFQIITVMMSAAILNIYFYRRHLQWTYMNLALLPSSAVSSGKCDSRGSALQSASGLSPLEQHMCHHGWWRVLWTAWGHWRGVTGETRGVMSDCSCIIPCRGCARVAFQTGWLGFWKAWRIQWQGYIDEVGGSCARQEHRCRGGAWACWRMTRATVRGWERTGGVGVGPVGGRSLSVGSRFTPANTVC